MRTLARRVAFSASLLLAVAAAQAAPAPLTFMALGDWGGGPLWW